LVLAVLAHQAVTVATVQILCLQALLRLAAAAVVRAEQTVLQVVRVQVLEV
jgi:hypothetical protein